MKQQRLEEAEKRKSSKRRSQRRDKVRRQKIKVREEVEQSRSTVCFNVFPKFCGSRGSKSRLAKAAGAEPSGQMRDEKLHAVVARSTFASEKAKSTSRLEHFWKLRCSKSALRCGPKHISKSTCTKHRSVGALLEVEMWKKHAALWSAAHFEVKMCKTPQCRSIFGS